MSNVKLKIGFISLGCPKNLTDTETMIGILSGSFEIVSDPLQAEIIIVNTCGFIESAKQESINTILEMNSLREKGRLKKLIVTGCLAQRYCEDILKEMPEVDAVVGTGSSHEIMSVIESVLQKNRPKVMGSIDAPIIENLPRVVSTGKGFAYLKIAEGCNNHCTFCVIPKIRGKYRSRKMEDIIREATTLSENGITELIVIAQDTTFYGKDLYNEYMLPKLLERLSEIKNIKWIRLYYTYPELIGNELIKAIKENKKVVKYLDIPMQHVSDEILKKMGRKGTGALYDKLIKKLKKEIPNISIRTTFITGFPSETEEDFNMLCSFIEKARLDKVGVFAYSEEEDTAAAKMKNKIPKRIREKRRNILMKLQQGMSLDILKGKIGKTFEVVCEDINDAGYIGRSAFDAPEIDGLVYFTSGRNIKIGEYVNVKIKDSAEYDIFGVEI